MAICPLAGRPFTATRLPREAFGSARVGGDRTHRCMGDCQLWIADRSVRVCCKLSAGEQPSVAALSVREQSQSRALPPGQRRLTKTS